MATARAESLPDARRLADGLGGRFPRPLRRRACGRLSVLTGVAPDARLPRAQLCPLPVARYRARRGGAPIAGGRRCEDLSTARRPVPRRYAACAADERGDRAKDRPQDPPGSDVLRPGDCRWWAGWTGCRGVWRQ